MNEQNDNCFLQVIICKQKLNDQSLYEQRVVVKIAINSEYEDSTV